MYTWAVLAVKEAAIASGLGASVVRWAGAGSLDGFAIGALMSGTCILMLTSPRRAGRRSLASGGRALAAAREKDQEQAGDEPEPGAPGPPPDEAGPAAGERQDSSGGYRSRHRLPEQNEGSSRQGTRRSEPRHAAPFSARLTGRLAVRALAGGVRG